MLALPEDLANTFDELECSAEKKKKIHFEERGWRLGRVPVRTYFRWKISVQLLHDGSGWPETWPILYCIIIALSGSTVCWNWSSDGDTYKPQKECFGNKDVSVHGVMFLYREEEEGLLLTEYHDTFSATNDTHNCFFCFVLFCFVLFFFNASCLKESVNNWKCLPCNKNSICFIGLDFWSTDKKCLNQHSFCQC